MDDEINYEELVQDGLRGVVRETLVRVAEEGMIGLHHFYISFSTEYPGVQLGESLKERHPEEMTIVLQHQFWGLEVDDEGFFVTLSFNDTQERIYIPFNALLSFMDPSVKFGLQFSPPPVFDLEETAVVEGPAEQDAKPVKDDENKDNVVTLDAFRDNKKK